MLIYVQLVCGRYAERLAHVATYCSRTLRFASSWRCTSGTRRSAKASAIGIETVLTPIRVPQANGIAERLIGTLRRDCTNHIIPLSERHLRRVLLEYVAYYNATRPHQTLGQETPQGPREVRLAGMVRGEEVLGGIHHRYERVAA